LISRRITDVPGASEVFTGSIIAYSNDVKININDVPENLIKKHGAVSEEVAKAMAHGVRNRLKSDYGISVTGIAGPGGGTDKKPVGTVCFGFAVDNEVISVTRRIIGSREKVRQFSALYAIDYLRKYFRDK